MAFGYNVLEGKEIVHVFYHEHNHFNSLALEKSKMIQKNFLCSVLISKHKFDNFVLAKCSPSGKKCYSRCTDTFDIFGLDPGTKYYIKIKPFGHVLPFIFDHSVSLNNEFLSDKFKGIIKIFKTKNYYIFTIKFPNVKTKHIEFTNGLQCIIIIKDKTKIYSICHNQAFCIVMCNQIVLPMDKTIVGKTILIKVLYMSSQVTEYLITSKLKFIKII